jgi:hypothetical protein
LTAELIAADVRAVLRVGSLRLLAAPLSVMLLGHASTSSTSRVVRVWPVVGTVRWWAE